MNIIIITETCLLYETIHKDQYVSGSWQPVRRQVSQYRVDMTTLSRIVPEVCKAISVTMQEHFMRFLKSSQVWPTKAVNLHKDWTTHTVLVP